MHCKDLFWSFLFGVLQWKWFPLSSLLFEMVPTTGCSSSSEALSSIRHCCGCKTRGFMGSGGTRTHSHLSVIFTPSLACRKWSNCEGDKYKGLFKCKDRTSCVVSICCYSGRGHTGARYQSLPNPALHSWRQGDAWGLFSLLFFLFVCFCTIHWSHNPGLPGRNLSCWATYPPHRTPQFFSVEELTGGAVGVVCAWSSVWFPSPEVFMGLRMN